MKVASGGLLALVCLLLTVQTRSCDWTQPWSTFGEDGLYVGGGVRPAALLVDGARDGRCVPDEMRIGRNRIDLGNLSTLRETCRDEIAVFRADRGLSLLSGDNWGPATGETHYATGGLPPIAFEVVVWVQQIDDYSRQRVLNQHCRAHQLFNVMMCGIAPHLSIAQQQSAYEYNEKELNPCNTPDRLRRLGHRPGAINVYYIPGDGSKGKNCKKDRSLIWVSSGGDYETLAHEIGHAFGLSRDNDHPNVGENIMASSTSTRSVVALGQCFQMNLNDVSIVHALSSRLRGKQRHCTESKATPECPSRLWPEKEIGKDYSAYASTDAAVLAWLDCEECEDNELRQLRELATWPGRAQQIADRMLAHLRDYTDVETHLRETFVLLAEYDARHTGAQLGSPDYASFRRHSGTTYRRGLRGLVALTLMESDDFDPTSQKDALVAELAATLEPSEVQAILMLASKVVIRNR